MNFCTTLRGEYRFVITRGDGSTEDTGWFPNLILDQGLDRMGSAFQTPIFSICRVGTGNSTPVNTQTALDSPLGSPSTANSTANSNTNEGAPLYRSTLTFNYVFAQGAVVGNISEVGVGWATTGNTLFSRALILDNLGSPTTITLVAIDQLTVFYRVRVAPTLTDATGSVLIGSTTYNFTSRVCSAANFGNVQYIFAYGHEYLGKLYIASTYQAGAGLAAITASVPTGTQSGANSTGSLQAYTPGTFYRDSSLSFSISQGNATGGIQALSLVYGEPYQPFRFQIVFNTPIPKTNTNVLTLTIRFSWARG
jgi:hypothetical protein